MAWSLPLVDPLNPLHIPQILSRLFDYNLSMEDLKNVRQVSTDFHRESLQKWRNTAKLVLSGAKTKDFLKLLRDAVEHEDYQQIISQPFRNYAIFSDPLICPHPIEPVNDFNRLFWNTLGPHMTTLSIDRSFYLPKVNFPSGMEWLFTACKNLQKLTINNPISYRRDANNNEGPSKMVIPPKNGNSVRLTAPHIKELSLLQFAILFFYTDFQRNLEMGKNLFKMFPQLSHLKLDSSTQLIIGGLAEPLDSQGSFIKLETLDINLKHSVNRAIFTPFLLLKHYIDVAKPPLKNLKINFNIYEARYHVGVFSSFLGACATSLERLELNINYKCTTLAHDHYYFDELLGIKFPKLTHLIITFEGFADPLENIRNTFNFKCLRKMPLLQLFQCFTLNLNGAKCIHDHNNFFHLPELFKVNDYVLKKLLAKRLEHVQIFECPLPRKFSYYDIIMLHVLMPNLTTLGLFYDFEDDDNEITGPLVFTLWHTMKGFKLYYPRQNKMEWVATLTKFNDLDIISQHLDNIFDYN